MKKIKNITLIVASFIAGVAFIISCGGSIRSFAEDIAAAISFDNSETNLDSTTAQDAIEEIANTIPFVYDANGNKVGIFQRNDSDSWIIYDLKTNIPVYVEPITGFIYSYKGELVYTTEDCSGTAYFPYGTNYIDTSFDLSEDYDDLRIYQSTKTITLDNKHYWYKHGGNKIKAEEIKSFKTSRYNGTTTCCPLSETLTETGTISSASSLTSTSDFYKIIPVYIEAKEVDLTPYAGPLDFFNK